MPGRNRAWADTIFCGSVLVDEGSSLINLLLDAPVVDTLTAVRIVIDLSIGPLVTTTVEASNCISVGIGVSSREAVTAAAIPDPAQSDQYPPRGWLYVANKASRFIIQSSGIHATYALFQADLHAMRKVDKGVLFLAMGNAGVIGTESVAIFGRVRVLCLT